MSNTLKRILAAQHTNESPFFKDSQGRIMELTASQGEVFTGFYQADDGTYYTESDWLDHQRTIELERIAEEEYQAEQKLLASQREARKRKQELLEAQQKKEQQKKSINGKTLLFSILIVSGVVALLVVFLPGTPTPSQSTTPDTIITDTIAVESPTEPFGNAIITGKEVRMRAQPNLQGKIITYFANEGERVLIIQAVNDTLAWARVRRDNGTEGWVFGTYVQKTD
ncbi:MAG: hypothetical protein CMC70_11090 [Flavobacteriaceae bacterium]|nr:hypothetical protein [Flavobacteriaceae bacterium]